MGKNENGQKGAFIKTPFKGLSSSRFLPKGTKAKVNLEDQGRQKVSFSFSLTKKTLPNRFLTALSGDAPQEATAVLSQTEKIAKLKLDFAESTGATEEPSPKLKLDLGKVHFKKHLLNATRQWSGVG